jgi:deoxynucleoside triphosphate triphosphohydrolase SAMHD1
MNCTRIYDPIHGFISITSLMKQFINTEEFQRLRDLKQLGATTFVFPSANHTRFEHSIGVSHLAGLMIESLKKNGLETITERNIELCRLAGLLHDIGHGPFSHLYDDYVKDSKEPDHEERGCVIIRNMVKKYKIPLKDFEVDDIIKMINPSDDEKFHWKYQIVANKINQLDVDKLDYIQRDCFYLGMKCAGEYSRIINDATVFIMNEKKSVIAWPIKLQYEIFQLFATRYRLHKQVYNHPNIKACEFIIIEMLKILRQKSIILKNFGDSIIYCKYVDYLRNKLFQRNHIKYVGELTFVNDNISSDSWGKYINYMKENNIFYQKLQIGFGGDKNPLKNIKYFKDCKIIVYDPMMFSFMIPTTYKEVLIRVYCKNMDKCDTIKMHYNKMIDIYNGKYDF